MVKADRSMRTLLRFCKISRRTTTPDCRLPVLVRIRVPDVDCASFAHVTNEIVEFSAAGIIKRNVNVTRTAVIQRRSAMMRGGFER